MTKYIITMKNEVYDEIFAIMHNINELNKGYELGGWFFGKWNYTEETDEAILNLNEFIIPKQKVHKTEVDISPDSMIDMIKEFGIEKMNEIVAHWHIHPFGKGKTNWSGGDEEKISNWMDPNKNRQVFCFLLSSEDEIKGRIIINKIAINPLTNFEEYVQESIDDIAIQREIPLSISPLIEKIKKRIDEKVEVTTYTYNTNFNKNTNNFNNDNKKSKKQKRNEKKELNLENCFETKNQNNIDIFEDFYNIEEFKEGICVKMSNDLYTYIWKFYTQNNSIPNVFYPDNEAHEINQVIWFYKMDENVDRSSFKTKLKDIFEEALLLIEEDKLEKSYTEAYYSRGYVNDYD